MINYVVKKSNGKIYATIPNNVILGPNQPNENPVPINLVGRNKVSYGLAFNENFLHMTEHFAGQSAPKGSVPGQIWYNYFSTTGQLLIALKDSAQQPDPSNPVTEMDWASIPMIANFNTVPDSDTSLMGRMVLTNNGDSLMVVMKDKEWREIQTTRPLDKEYQTLLDISYDTGKRYISFQNGSSSKPVAYFNKGGAYTADPAGYAYFQNGQGALLFGANYFYELKIVARAVTDTNGTVTSVPTTYKTWLVKGSYFVENDAGFQAGVTYPRDLPDPRKISGLRQIIDVIDQGGGADNWNISVQVNPIDPALANATGTTVTDYNNYVTASLNSKIHLGFRIQGNIDNLNVGEQVLTQWNVYLHQTGIRTDGV